MYHYLQVGAYFYLDAPLVLKTQNNPEYLVEELIKNSHFFEIDITLTVSLEYYIK
jgi:hypothetical protein